MTRPGIFYGLGVGPGDPELLTLKAARILREVPVVCYPSCKEGAPSYASRIIENFLQPHQTVRGLLFPMQKDLEALLPVWKEQLAIMVGYLRQGKDVAFATEGDPFFYSTFVYMYELIREEHPEIEVQVVPGVSSVMASSVKTGWPLTMADERMAILPATYEDSFIEKALDDFDTVVFLKVNTSLKKLAALLKKKELLKKAVVVECCGSPKERIFWDVEAAAKERLNYLSLVIVKKERLAAYA